MDDNIVFINGKDIDKDVKQRIIAFLKTKVEPTWKQLAKDIQEYLPGNTCISAKGVTYLILESNVKTSVGKTPEKTVRSELLRLVKKNRKFKKRLSPNNVFMFWCQKGNVSDDEKENISKIKDSIKRKRHDIKIEIKKKIKIHEQEQRKKYEQDIESIKKTSTLVVHRPYERFSHYPQTLSTETWRQFKKFTDITRLIKQNRMSPSFQNIPLFASFIKNWKLITSFSEFEKQVKSTYLETHPDKNSKDSSNETFVNFNLSFKWILDIKGSSQEERFMFIWNSYMNFLDNLAKVDSETSLNSFYNVLVSGYSSDEIVRKKLKKKINARV